MHEDRFHMRLKRRKFGRYKYSDFFFQNVHLNILVDITIVSSCVLNMERLEESEYFFQNVHIKMLVEIIVVFASIF